MIAWRPLIKLAIHLANAIDRAWYRQKVVTLVAFDLKGAFNGVD
jgi:hypothetical protein